MTNLTDMGCVGNFYEHKDKMPREVEVGEMEKYRLVNGQAQHGTKSWRPNVKEKLCTNVVVILQL